MISRILIYLSLFTLYFSSGIDVSRLWAIDQRIDAFVDSRHYDVGQISSLKLTPGKGKTLYVDGKNGDDKWDGLSPKFTQGMNGPKRSLHAVLDRYSNPGPGVHILIRAGKYDDLLWVPETWGPNDEQHRLMIGPYGDGEVILDTSLWRQLGKWEPVQANIFRVSTNNNQVAAIILDDDFKSFHPVSSMKEIQQYGDWFWNSSDGHVYVHTNGINPTDHDVIVQKADPNGGDASYWVYGSASYVTLYGLTIRGNPSKGWISGSHWNIDRCKIYYTARGTQIDGSFSKITRCLFKGNVMRNWPRGNNGYSNTDGGWVANFATTVPNSYFAGNIVMDSGGEGVLLHDNALIEDNIFVDNFSVDIYGADAQHQTIRKNICLTTQQNFTDLIGWPNPRGERWEKIRRKLRANGVALATESGPSRFTGFKIYNNIFIAKRYGISQGDAQGDFGVKDTSITNNLIILPSEDMQKETGDTYTGLSFATNPNNHNSTVQNNIVIGGSPSTALIKRGSDRGISFDYNIYFHPTNPNPFIFEDTKSSSFTSWQKRSQQDAHSIYENPSLNRESWTTNAPISLNDFQLRSTSQALDRGISLSSEFAEDYNAIPRPQGKGWDIGPFEH